MSLRLRAAAAVGAAAGLASRALGRGSGSVISGWVTETLAPGTLAEVLARYRVALISGTNGKTTTNAFVAAALRTAGPVVTNAKGANMPAGILAALARTSGGGFAAIEVDEGYLPRLIEVGGPEAVALLNLSRDQLDRVAEVRKIAERWRDALAGTSITVFANADDPAVVFAARGARTVWIAAGSNWRVDAASCPSCGARIHFDDASWRCTGCDLARPETSWELDETGAGVAGVSGHPRIDLALPGRHNQHNALVALAVALHLGADETAAIAAMARVDDVEGRYARPWPGSDARLYLSKNPAGWIEIINLVEVSPRDVLIAINANIADGKDTSWLWDVPFERLAGKRAVAAGERCHDLAVRLRYADVDVETIESLPSALQAARSRDLDVIANYTAFRDVRRELKQ